MWPIETEERRGAGGPGPRGKPGRGARPSSRLSAYSSLRRFSFPSEPCGRRSISRGGAGAGWSEEPGSPSSRGVAWPPGRVGCVARRRLGARGPESGPGGGGRGVEAPSPEGAGGQALSISGAPRESSSWGGERGRAPHRGAKECGEPGLRGGAVSEGSLGGLRFWADNEADWAGGWVSRTFWALNREHSGTSESRVAWSWEGGSPA